MKKFKKIASISLIMLFVVALMSSCKSRDKCPGMFMKVVETVVTK